MQLVGVDELAPPCGNAWHKKTFITVKSGGDRQDRGKLTRKQEW